MAWDDDQPTHTAAITGTVAAQRIHPGAAQQLGLARALVARPTVLIADEPTAQLDSATAATIIDLIATLVAERTIAAVVSTHQAGTAARGTRLWNISDGVVSEAPSAG